MAKQRPGVITEQVAEQVKEAPAPAPAPKVSDAGFTTNFSKQREIDHHVFKLMPATVITNKSYRAMGYLPLEQEHGHVYHTISSHGQAKEYCEPVAGHQHKVTMTNTKKDADGVIISGDITCGPAVVLANVKNSADTRNKSYVKKMLRPAVKDDNGDPIEGPDGAAMYDDHVHKVTYVKGEKLSINI